MSASDAPTTSTLRAQRVPRWYTGRSELFVAAGVIALAVVMTIGTVTMTVPDGASPPGPQFFPTIVTILLYAVGIGLAIEVLAGGRRGHVAEDPAEISDEMLAEIGSLDRTSEIRVVSPEESAPEKSNEVSVDWRTLGISVAALAAFILVLPFLGWLISASALFWVLAWAFGSRRPLFDIAIAALMGALTELAFAAGLGLTLPAGILEGALSWIS
ncbi:tripartite tricarboxylate transporter TctB family protein [Microbacterium karelineae]|uniref:tripartite tricarboxylate transporter TctB family protein n=1 Tax=Microbacterium karelineae TaxID=2654283 RepID=UPI0012EA1FC0|nr:tripartite tricarboxylate transporter TctB family protein [Microbacterium karelineae]